MKRLRRLFVCLVCLCVVMSAQGCGSIAGVSSGKRIIRISHAQSETHPEHLGLLKFKEYVEENQQDMEEEFADTAQDWEAPEEENVGDINPYTGMEYESNSVRMHPKRIGYVQVYDRSDHQWTDMTEWAFLGYQERKKVLLGEDYEPPIYLD